MANEQERKDPAAESDISKSQSQQQPQDTPRFDKQ